jgi:phosphoribosylamine--glycine ligase
MGLRVMVVGSGGREHALCWALSRHEEVDAVVAAPGNPGIAELPKTAVFEVEPNRIQELADLAESQKVDVTVVGPEQPLVDGIADYFETRGLVVFGPSKECARLEGSKSFAKEVMEKAGVPTPAAKVFDGPEQFADAEEYIRATEGPWVVKADGLAAGKGVLVTSNAQKAIAWARACMIEDRFGKAGHRILLEQFASGKEASVLVLTDGKGILPLPPARDYKRLADGDEGPNTGGMGAFSPVPEIDERSLDYILEKIFEPVIDSVRKTGRPYLGVLYGGLILTEEGPKVLEFNVRFGDPEAQVVVPRIAPSLLDAIDAALAGELDRVKVQPAYDAAVCVVAASSGYPEKPKTGMRIEGLNQAAEHGRDGKVVIFHAGTKRGPGGEILTAGGRVLGVTGLGDSIKSARERAYRALEEISFEGMRFRSDIAAGVEENT